MGTGIELIVLISVGYAFCLRCYLTRYVVARQAGYKLYLSGATVGTFFYLLSILMYELQFVAWSLLSEHYLLIVSNEFKPKLILFLSIVYAGVFSEWYNRRPYSKEINLLEAWASNDVEALCSDAANQFKPIAVSLDTGKVYVGLVYDSLEPDKHESYLTILPMYSGYRTDPENRMILTTSYREVDRLLVEMGSVEVADVRRVEDYCITFSRDRIVTINIFNEHLYKGFEKGSAD